MARSPLMSALVRALRDVRGAARAGIPVLDYAARRKERRELSRRRLLEGATASLGVAVLGGAGATTGCSLTTDLDPRPFDPNQHEIAIVGGGLAGLTCAYRLSGLSVTAHVFEATPSFGGRVHTARDVFPGGQHAELGGELIDTRHTAMLALAQELEVELLDHRRDDAELEQVVAYVDGALLDEEAILAEMAPLSERIERAVGELWQPDAGVSKANPNGGQRLDALSIAEWLDEVGLAQGRARKILDAALTSELGLDLGESNALNMLLPIASSTEELALFGNSDGRFRAKNGSSAFVEALVAALPEETLHQGHALRAIRKGSDGRYVLTFDAEGGTIEEKARRVVLALPFATLRDVAIEEGLFPEPKMDAIRTQGFGRASKLLAGFGARPWRSAHGASGATFSDLGYQSTWDASRLQEGEAGILAVLAGGARADALLEGTPESQLASFLAQIDLVFSGTKAAGNGKVLRAEWPRMPFAKAAYSAARVGELTRIGGTAGERVENVHFAGEHTSDVGAGFMEGAVRSGERAAAEIAEDLGLSLAVTE